MLKILQARLQQYVNQELPEDQAGFRKGRGTRNQIANIHWIIEKEREFQKNIYFCFIDYTKDFDCVDHNKLWKNLKRWEYQITWPASWGRKESDTIERLIWSDESEGGEWKSWLKAQCSKN